MKPTSPLLVVDDEACNLAALERILSPRYALVFAKSGSEALNAARKHMPALILLDIQMPGADGYEVCRTLKQEEGLAHIPVIFLSAFTDAASKVLAFESGGSDYVSKPFSPDEILARIQTQLKVLHAERQMKESYDRLKEMEALRDSLVHMMVHDLRSPLMVMELSLELLKEEAGHLLSPKSNDRLGMAYRSTRRMSEMVDTVLDLNKLESGQMALNIESCALEHILQDVVDSHRDLAGGRRLVLDVPGAISVRVDRELLFRVFQNLLSNAIKFTPQDKEIRIQVAQAHDGIQVQFIDQGPGIPAQDRERIFAKFGQVGTKGQPGWASTGLGLTFCKLAVEAHKGSLGVENAPGGGACFLLQLPTG